MKREIITRKGVHPALTNHTQRHSFDEGDREDHKTSSAARSCQEDSIFTPELLVAVYSLQTPFYYIVFSSTSNAYEAGPSVVYNADQPLHLSSVHEHCARIQERLCVYYLWDSGTCKWGLR